MKFNQQLIALEETTREAFITVRLTKDERKALDKLARKHRTKLSKLVRIAIRQFIDPKANAKRGMVS